MIVIELDFSGSADTLGILLYLGPAIHYKVLGFDWLY